MTKDAVRHIPKISWAGGLILSVLWVVIVGTSFAYGQVSPEEHKQHHPGQAGNSGDQGSGTRGEGQGGGMMGGKGGGMGGMMEKWERPSRGTCIRN